MAHNTLNQCCTNLIQVEAYFSRLHYLMPVINKPEFIAKYKALMDNTANTQLARTETPFISLVFAVFACAASLVQDPRLKVNGRDDDGGMGMVYYERYAPRPAVMRPLY